LWRKDGFGEGRLGKENKEEGGHEVSPQTYRNVIPYKGAVDVGEGAAMQRTQTRDTQNQYLVCGEDLGEDFQMLIC